MFATTNATPIYRGRSFRDRFRSYLAAFHRHSIERRNVRILHGMSDRMLRDIGVSREQALRETPRPFRDFIF